MPTAKSYENLKQLSEPFTENGKNYILVELKSGKSKKVRWYTQLEYNKMYQIKGDPSKPWWGPQKDVLGFANGPISVSTAAYEDERLRQSSARYCKQWGWYFVSGEPVPKDIETFELSWEQVGNEDGYLKSEKEIRRILNGIK